MLALRSGCCPEPDATTTEAGTRRYLINGKVFKNARDNDGVHLSAGRDRDTPWIAIPPVVRAIRVMESIVGDGDLLFERDTPHSTRTPNPGRSLTHKTAAHRIERLITWINDYAQNIGRAAEVIPPDPDGGIGISRFRRTLACARSVSDHVAVRSAHVAVRSAGVETRSLVSPLQLAGPTAA